MARPRKADNLKMVNVGVTVSPDVDVHLTDIAEKQDRSKSYVARELILRGLAAYLRDGQLREPKEPDIRSIIDEKAASTARQRPADVRDISKRSGKKKA